MAVLTERPSPDNPFANNRMELIELEHSELGLVFSPYDFDGFRTVMPAQAGIQESQAEASSSPVWISAFAGMTQPHLPPQIQTDGLLVLRRINFDG
jgi:hypothetical protein